ncbi:MAG TPA: tyrosine-type recombinase/integrase [Verrucomicrobiae bacterium]|jgi:integrase
MASIWKHPKSKYWSACYTDHSGRRVKKSTKKTDRNSALLIALEYARAEAKSRDGVLTGVQCRKVLSEILEKTTGESIRHVSTEDFFENWLKGKDATASAGTAQRYDNVKRLFLASLGAKAKKPLDAITTPDVQNFLTQRIKSGVAPKTVSVDRKTLAHAFNRALILGSILLNPVKATELPKIVSSKRKTFTNAEVSMLIEAAPSTDWRTVILLGYYIGARLRDCTGLKWENVDLINTLISYVPKKTEGTTQDENLVTVPIHPDLEEHLSTLASSDKGETYLCPALADRKTGGAHGLSQTFKKIMKSAGIDAQMAKGKGLRQFSKLSFHSLRHSCNSALTNAGVNQETRMKLTGHKTAAVNTGYTHHELAPLRAAVNMLPSVLTKKQLAK